MKLSIVIITYNSRKDIEPCLRSIFERTKMTDFEVILSDNDSKDDSMQWVRENFPHVRIIENRANLGFAAANNIGIAAAAGEYIFILNPDTIMHEGALDKLVEFADAHPEAGAIGCRIVYADGRYQITARPFPSLWRYWVAALYLRWLVVFSDRFISDTYTGWEGETPREIDWQAGCVLFCRGDVLRKIGGFDPQFFFHFDEVDLCRRVWQSGKKVIFTPDIVITHVAEQSIKRFPLRVELEKYRNRYRYFNKYAGMKGVRRCLRVTLVHLRIRYWGYTLLRLICPTQRVKDAREKFRVSLVWNKQLDAARFLATGEEPDVGYPPLRPAPPAAAPAPVAKLP